MEVHKLRVAANEFIASHADRLKSGGGNGTYDGMDGWQQSVESRLGEVKSDIRDLRSLINIHFLFVLAAIGGSFIALLGVMMAGFGWIN